MGFLDSLENNLKSLESREDSAKSDQEDRRKQEAERARAQAAAPYADRLRNGPFTLALLDEATRIGHSQRTKVHIAWLGSNLRLEAKTRKLELRPTAQGVTAFWFENGLEVRQSSVDLDGNGADLAQEWLGASPAKS